jgi:ApaG protein
MSMSYEKTTGNVTIRVRPSFREDQSSPEKNLYIWAYQVKIENHGAETIRLMSRYWRITDGNGVTQEVAGEGVVGDQPVLQPGGIYEYTSGAPLPTPTGFMTGNYIMEGPDGKHFSVDIPAFSLDSPHHLSRIH